MEETPTTPKKAQRQSFAATGTAEFAEIQVGSEWGYFALNVQKKALFAHTTFGDYAYAWHNIGPKPFKEFLAGISFDSFVGKASPDANVFDQALTVKDIRKQVKEWKAEGEITAAQASEALYELKGVDAESSSEGEFCIRLQETGELEKALGPDWYEFIRRGPSRDCRNFWKVLWPAYRRLLLKQAKEEARVAEVPAPPAELKAAA